MMIKPGITELSRCVDSRYTLATMAAKRARMIGQKTQEVNGKYKAIKPVSIAADEIAQGKIGYVRSDAVQAAKEYEEEKEAAILSYSESAIEANAEFDARLEAEKTADTQEGEE